MSTTHAPSTTAPESTSICPHLEEDTKDHAELIAELCDLPDQATVVTMGGGAEILAALLLSHPTCKGVHLEFDEEIADAWALLTACGVAERCELQTARMYAAPPTAHLYIVADVSQSDHCTSGDVIDFVDTVSAVMPKGSWLVILDTMRDDPAPGRPASCDCEELCFCLVSRPHPPTQPGQEWSLAEYLHVLSPLGLRINSVRHPSPSYVLLALDSTEEPAGFSTPTPITRTRLYPNTPRDERPVGTVSPDK
ncbi:hypothetical protein [Sinosporangium siamense]|uniref:Uncharacterized protein n=1 Tax=Sinosporangium siamense TaxID=1367973 RepID=A0A919RMS3_9ACTN|nr:hypothetical protein [Sinosporangium siamense]GII94869.1 hypothetical protein Ssi02_51000 [Sinosporangium siamense]